VFTTMERVLDCRDAWVCPTGCGAECALLNVLFGSGSVMIPVRWKVPLQRLCDHRKIIAATGVKGRALVMRGSGGPTGDLVQKLFSPFFIPVLMADIVSRLRHIEVERSKVQQRRHIERVLFQAFFEVVLGPASVAFPLLGNIKIVQALLAGRILI